MRQSAVAYSGCLAALSGAGLIFAVVAIEFMAASKQCLGIEEAGWPDWHWTLAQRYEAPVAEAQVMLNGVVAVTGLLPAREAEINAFA
ncbi:MAG: hypothetical protein AB8B85_22735 [Paracoccaceae bacterium]